MSLKNERELPNTQAKLDRLERRCKALRNDSGGDGELRAMTMESLRRTIKECGEETARNRFQNPGGT